MKTSPEMTTAEPSGQRLTSQLRVYYGADQQKLLPGFSVDLSTGGLYLKTDIPLTVDESLRLQFSLPNHDKTLSCKARVAWVNPADRPRKPELPPGVGIQFVDLSLEDLKSLKRFLEHNEIEPAW